MNEIVDLVEAERAFAATSKATSTRAAFLAFLADDAILFRPHPVVGKAWLAERPAPPGLLTWYPIHAEIARAGDLGYTTGPWELRETQPDDPPLRHGHYFSIWRKQPDRSWKVLIDLGIVSPPPASPYPAWEPPVNSDVPDTPGGIEPGRLASGENLLDEDVSLSQLSAERGTLRALLASATEDVRILRMGMQPLVGRAAVQSAPFEQEGISTWAPLGSEVARSRDLGFTYGRETRQSGGRGSQPLEQAYYVRIWRKEMGGRWRIALDVTNPIPPDA